MEKHELQAAQERLTALRDTRRFAQLSTLSGDGSPIASYAPCLVQPDGIYVYLSQLSGHCKNLLKDQRAGVLLIADENAVRNPFARQWVSYQCLADIVRTKDKRHSAILDSLTEVHGNTVDLLRQLPDFVLFCLKPIAGTYVEGFGKAFELTGAAFAELDHLDEQAARSRH